MSILPEEFTVHSFRCPNCKEYISSELEVCRFCSFEISSAVREEAIRGELDSNRQSNIKRAKNTIAIGAVLFAGGLLAATMPFLESYAGFRVVNISCFVPFMIIGGLGAAIYGFNDYRKARNRY